jgi:flagellin
VVSNPVGTQAAGTSSTSFLATFGIEGNVAAQGAGETKFMLHVTDRSISLQIGANESQTMDSSIGSFSANALGLVGLDVTSINSAKKALAAIDIAVNRVSSERSKLGSIQNRLGSTINNLTVTSTNLQAAESRIRDVDVAEETVSFTRSQILIQAGTAQLAQAKALPQQALQLIGG